MRREKVTEEKLVEDILENFDWNKCVLTMKLLNWRWALLEGEVQEYNLKSRAVQLMQAAINGVKSKDVNFHSSYFSSTGGLKATAWKNRFGHVTGLNLEFILTDWESDGDYYQDDLQ